MKHIQIIITDDNSNILNYVASMSYGNVFECVRVEVSPNDEPRHIANKVHQALRDYVNWNRIHNIVME